MRKNKAKLFKKKDIVNFLNVFNLEGPNEINDGHCFNFAYYLYLKHDKKPILCSVDDHAFIFYDGLFYDSDSPFGRKEWRTLKTCRSYNKKAEFLIENEIEFLDGWRYCNTKKVKKLIDI